MADADHPAPTWLECCLLHVDATHDSLENLVGATSPISEIWLWQPNLVEGRIISNPLLPISGNDWFQWTKAQGPANAFSLRANSTYLVRNTNLADFSWTIKGKPVPPTARWTASGLNFFGFSTRADSAPLFANFLTPTLALSAFHVFHYPGGEAVGASPNTAELFSLATKPVKRGEAFWIKKDYSDNRYFGPFEFVLQDYRGVVFSDRLAAYSLRLRNQLATSNGVVLTLLASELSPSLEASPAPPLLLRTTLNMTTLKYGFTNMPVNQARTFLLAPKGQPGSEVEVVIGLDRANMTGTNGASFTGVLRLQDTTLGHLQVDLPVTATKASTEGLWIGDASITQVGNYLKTYAKATNSVDFTNQLAQLNLLNQAYKTFSISNNLWTPHTVDAAPRNWACLASSANGSNLVAGVSGGRLYTSIDAGATWVARLSAPSAIWRAVASSADGARLAAVNSGGNILTSADSGVTWSVGAGAPATTWQSIASSSDGLKLAAVVDGGAIYISADGGQTWSPHAPITNPRWQSIACSADGKNLVAAINGGPLYASTNSGLNWAVLFGAPSTNWQAVASSADGSKLVAVANPGGIYTSTDFGATWDLKASAPPAANWQAIVSSADGNVLVAVVAGGRIYTSGDAGATWAARENNRGWSAAASSTDGTRLVAGETGGSGELYTTTGTLTLPALSYDPKSSLILSGGAKYLAATFDRELGDVPNPFPLRLIVHQGANGATKLLQRVFIGPDAITTNTILTRQEADLHPEFVASARRISAVHLPLSGEGWPLQGQFGGTGIMNAVLTDGFDDHASNPFLHSYHPDHDNLDALFQPVGSSGVESYDIKRQITLSFTAPGDDFTSRTVGSLRVQGVYLENIVLKGIDKQTRTIVTKGSFVLNRVSSIATLK